MNNSFHIKVDLPKIGNKPINNILPKLQTLLRPSFAIKNTTKHSNEFASTKRYKTEIYKN